MKSKSLALLLFVLNSLFLIFEFILYKRVSGLFLGTILSFFILMFYNRLFLIDYFFKLILTLNLCILIVNLFFREYLLIPPLLSSGDNVFEKEIIRNISIGTFSIDLNRSTGIIDNIHVSTLLLLYSIFIYYIEKKKKLFVISSIVFFLSLNFQFILIYLLFFFIKKFNSFFINNSKSLIFFVPFIFFIIDYVFLGQSYFYQISNSKFNLLIFELSHYIKYLDFGSFLYGIKPNMIDDPYDGQAGFYIPLTDIGIIGVPIQFGLFGITSILLNILYGIKYFPNQFKLLFKLLILTILHYFSLASFIGLLTTYWVSKYSAKKTSLK